MNTPSIESDPLAEDHSAPDTAEQLQAAACRTTEIARDNVWLITGGLFLLGIAIGAAATQAATPDCTVRNATQRSLKRAGHRSNELSREISRKVSAQMPTRIQLSDRLDNILEHLRFWE